MTFFDPEKRITVKMLSKQSPMRPQSSTNSHIEYIAKYLNEYVDISLEISDIANPIPKGFEKFIEDLSNLKDFQEIKSNLTYDQKVVINEIRKSVKDVDIVHVHHAGSFFEGLIAKLFFDKKLVVTFHALMAKREDLRSSIGEDIYNQCLMVEKLLSEHADSVIVTYKTHKDTLLKYYPNINTRKLYIVHNGININEFYPIYNVEVLKKYGIDPTVPFVILAGKLQSETDGDYAIGLVKRLHLFYQVVIVLRTPSNQGHKFEYVMKELEEIGKTKAGFIKIDANMSSDDKRVLCSHASVVCYPFVKEPNGFAILESLACGTPVVSTSIGCAKEIIKHGEGGFLIEPGLTLTPPYEPMDKDGFIKRISEATNRTLDDKSLNKRLSVRSRESIEETFSWNIIAKKTNHIYKKTLKG